MQVIDIVIGFPMPVPILARAVRAGFPSPADDFVEEEIDLQRLLVVNRPATFLVRVAGDSMLLAHLHDGDLAVVDRSLTPRTGDVVVVDIDGVSRRVWALFVGNNCYGETLRDLTGREQLDEGVLDLRWARANGRLSRLRIAGAVLFGRVAQSPLIERRAVSSIAIDAHGPLEVALDGEVMTMSPPLVYKSCPQLLRVLVPPEHDDSS